MTVFASVQVVLKHFHVQIELGVFVGGVRILAIDEVVPRCGGDDAIDGGCLVRAGHV
jgi:hypothetical protein